MLNSKIKPLPCETCIRVPHTVDIHGPKETKVTPGAQEESAYQA